MIGSASARVVNCLIYDNGGTSEREFGTANLDRYAYCASSVTNESCATWRVVDATAFAGDAAQGYRPNIFKKENPLVDTGSSFAEYLAIGPVSTSDFAGNERMTNDRMDIGYLEAKWRGSVLRFR